MDVLCIIGYLSSLYFIYIEKQTNCGNTAITDITVISIHNVYLGLPVYFFAKVTVNMSFKSHCNIFVASIWRLSDLSLRWT